MGNTCKNYSTISNDQPLILAVREGNTKRVKKLLKEWGKKGGTMTRALTEAAKNGRLEIVSYLLKSGDVNQVNSRGRTALIETVLVGNEGVVALLLDWKADPNVCDLTGNSPLVLAAEGGHCQILDILITRGADINYINPQSGMSALMVGCRHGHQAVVEMLCSLPSCNVELMNAKQQNSFMFACTYGHTEVAAVLLNRGCEFDVTDGDGATPFLKAAAHGHLNIVRLLVTKGCRPNATDITGHSALDLALHSQHEEVVGFLKMLLGVANNGESMCGGQTVEMVSSHALEINKEMDKIVDGDDDGVIKGTQTTDINLEHQVVELNVSSVDPQVINVKSTDQDLAGSREEIQEVNLERKDCERENSENKEADTRDLVNGGSSRELNKGYLKAKTYPRRSKSSLTELEHTPSRATLKVESNLPPVDQPIGGHDLTNQGLGGHDLTNQGLGGHDLTNQGLGGHDLTNQGLGGHDLTNQRQTERKKGEGSNGSGNKSRSKKKVYHCKKIVIFNADTVNINSLQASKEQLLGDDSDDSSCLT